MERIIIGIDKDGNRIYNGVTMRSEGVRPATKPVSPLKSTHNAIKIKDMIKQCQASVDSYKQRDIDLDNLNKKLHDDVVGILGDLLVSTDIRKESKDILAITIKCKNGDNI